MILLTIEGLDKSCEIVLRHLQTTLKSHVLPWPNLPVATNTHSQSGEISRCLAGVLAKMRCLHRAQTLCDTDESIVCGAHWIEMPHIMDQDARQVLHELVLDVSAKLAHIFDLHVRKHVIVFIKSSEHEMFERLIESMESRDVLLSDLEDMSSFLQEIHRHPDRASIFPSTVRQVDYPPYANDNTMDAAQIACDIVSVLPVSVFRQNIPPPPGFHSVRPSVP